jgi:hypothetical protein
MDALIPLSQIASDRLRSTGKEELDAPLVRMDSADVGEPCSVFLLIYVIL